MCRNNDLSSVRKFDFSDPEYCQYCQTYMPPAPEEDESEVSEPTDENEEAEVDDGDPNADPATTDPATAVEPVEKKDGEKKPTRCHL